MKKKTSGKVISIIMVIIVIILAIVGVWGFVSGDKDPPVIIIEEKELTYKDNDSYDSLLESVTARDEVDGEVQVYVENIYPLYGNEEAKVYFTATDSSGNVTKESVIVKYIKDDEEATEKDDEDVIDDEEIEDSETDEAEKVDSEVKNSGTKNSSKGSSDDDANTEDDALVSDSNDTYPQVILTTDRVVLSVGEKFYYAAYIENLIDDVDSYGELEKRIITDGASINTNEKGTYTVKYSVKDTDGNTAEPVVLTVVVK